MVRKTAGRQVGPEPGARVGVDQLGWLSRRGHRRFARLLVPDDHLLIVLDHVKRGRLELQLLAGLLEETLGCRVVSQVFRDVFFTKLVPDRLSRQELRKDATATSLAGARRFRCRRLVARFRVVSFLVVRLRSGGGVFGVEWRRVEQVLLPRIVDEPLSPRTE